MCQQGIDYDVCIHNEYECWKTPPGNFEIINFRYLLKKRGDNPLIIIGCNPSKAYEKKLDPTMKIVEELLKNDQFDYDGYIMLNLYPQIAPKVEALPADIPQHINHINHFNNVNIHIIEDSLRENSNSNILFAFGELIKKREFLYNTCYNHIREVLRTLIGEGIIRENQIKKLAGGNARVNVNPQNNYPPHFRNAAFWGNGINLAVIAPFDFEAYHI